MSWFENGILFAAGIVVFILALGLFIFIAHAISDGFEIQAAEARERKRKETETLAAEKLEEQKLEALIKWLELEK